MFSHRIKISGHTKNVVMYTIRTALTSGMFQGVHCGLDSVSRSNTVCPRLVRNVEYYSVYMDPGKGTRRGEASVKLLFVVPSLRLVAGSSVAV